MTLKNRIIFAPTTMGLPLEEYLEKLRQIAAGGCAMIIIGDVPVGKSDSAWVNKAMEGKTNEIQRCVRCNQKCLGGMQQHHGVHCIYEKEITK